MGGCVDAGWRQHAVGWWRRCKVGEGEVAGVTTEMKWEKIRLQRVHNQDMMMIYWGDKNVGPDFAAEGRGAGLRL